MCSRCCTTTSKSSAIRKSALASLKVQSNVAFCGVWIVGRSCHGIQSRFQLGALFNIYHCAAENSEVGKRHKGRSHDYQHLPIGYLLRGRFGWGNEAIRVGYPRWYGNAVPEKPKVNKAPSGGSYFMVPIHPGKSIQRQLILNKVFDMNSPGSNTIQAWRESAATDSNVAHVKIQHNQY